MDLLIPTDLLIPLHLIQQDRVAVVLSARDHRIYYLLTQRVCLRLGARMPSPEERAGPSPSCIGCTSGRGWLLGEKRCGNGC